MEVGSRVSPEEGSVSDQLPLAEVQFTQPVPIPGSSLAMGNITVGESRTQGGATFVCPMAWLVISRRAVRIGNTYYPLERVVYWRQAKMARDKITPVELPNYTIGKRA